MALLLMAEEQDPTRGWALCGGEEAIAGETLAEAQLLGSLIPILTGRWGASRWRWARGGDGAALRWMPYPDSYPPDASLWRPMVSAGRTDAEGWQHALDAASVGQPRDGGNGERRPVDRARWREWRRHGDGSAASELSWLAAAARSPLGRLEAPGVRDAARELAAFLRTLMLPLWRARSFALLPPDPRAPVRLSAKHTAHYEACFRHLLSRPIDHVHALLAPAHRRQRAEPGAGPAAHAAASAPAAPPASGADGWVAGERVSAALLEDLHGAMVHARAAFGFAALHGHLASVGSALAGYALSAGYRRVDGAAHTAALCSVSGMQPADVRLARWEPRPYLPVHYLALDRRRNWIVLAVRGTHSPWDVVTDLNAAAERFALRDDRRAARAAGGSGAAGGGLASDEEGEGEAAPRTLGNVHAGMLAAARQIVRSVGPTLRALQQEAPSARVVVVGHSMGGGTAALVAALLRDPLADVAMGAARTGGAGLPPPRPIAPAAVGFALSPPAMADLASARLLGQFVTSAIVGVDAVPRFCVANALRLATELENEASFRSAFARLSAVAQTDAFAAARAGAQGAAVLLGRAAGASAAVASGLGRALLRKRGAPTAAPRRPAAACAAPLHDGAQLPVAELRRGGAAHHFPPGRCVQLCDRPCHAELEAAHALGAAGGLASLGPRRSVSLPARRPGADGGAQHQPDAAPALPIPGSSSGGLPQPARAHSPRDVRLSRPPSAALCEPGHYCRLLLMPEMMADHLPDRVLALLERARLEALAVETWAQACGPTGADGAAAPAAGEAAAALGAGLASAGLGGIGVADALAKAAAADVQAQPPGSDEASATGRAAAWRAGAPSASRIDEGEEEQEELSSASGVEVAEYGAGIDEAGLLGNAEALNFLAESVALKRKNGPGGVLPCESNGS